MLFLQRSLFRLFVSERDSKKRRLLKLEVGMSRGIRLGFCSCIVGDFVFYKFVDLIGLFWSLYDV